jgi:c-di-GMP phosphodiesterase
VLTTQLGNGEPSTRFLVGLLSRMDVLLGLPIDQVLERLPVSRDVRDALINGTGPHATILSLAIAYEAGDWTVVDVVGTDSVSSPLGEIYGEATAWASERLRSVG